MNDLVSVETQSEYSLTTGLRETRIFVKFYVEAVRSGMVADMGAERLQTLLVLASFMDANGECFPTQWQIAEALGVARETANRRVRRLYNYRWKGRRLIEMRKVRNDEKQTWVNTVYTILPVSNLEIFDGERI